MRLIEEQMLAAVRNQVIWSKTNTSVVYRSANNISHISLHGNHIATYDHANRVMVPNLKTLAEWPTRTTKSRLKALGVNVETLKALE